MPVTKPSILPRWATGMAVITEPTEPEKDTGFVPGTPASAAHTNWLLNRLYLWMQYLNDPATFTSQSIVAGGLNISGAITTATLSTTGNATVGGTLGATGRVTANGGLTVAIGQTSLLQGNTTVGGTLGVTGATTVSNTLGVTGLVTASAGITVPAGQTAALQGNTTVGGTLGVTGTATLAGNATVAGTLGVTGAVTAGGVTAAANQHVTVSGTGDYRHGDKILQLPASAGTPVNASDGLSGQPATSATGWKHTHVIGAQALFWYGPAANQDVIFPIILKVGDRIKAVSARIQDTSSGHTISMFVHKSVTTSSFTSGSSQVGSTQTSAGTGAIQLLTLSGLTATLASFEMYNVVLRANGSTFTNHRILGIQVTYDRP